MTEKTIDHSTFTTSASEKLPVKSYMTHIDIMRLIACIAVIVIHVTATPVMTLAQGSRQQLFFIIINRMAKPSVPLFIFISGYLAFPIWQGSLKVFYYKKSLRLLLPYVSWTLIYHLLFIVRGVYPLSLRFFLEGLIKGDMMYHLYFMLILIQLTLFTPFWRFIERRFSIKGLLFFAALVQLGSIGLHLPYQDRLWTTYILYYVLGMTLRAYPKKICPPLATCIALALGTLYSYQFYQSINYYVNAEPISATLLYMTFSMASCYAVFHFSKALAAQLDRRHHDSLKRWAASTEWLYYAHPLGILAGNYAMGYLPFQSIIFKSVLGILFIILFILPLAYYAPRFTPTLRGFFFQDKPL